MATPSRRRAGRVGTIDRGARFALGIVLVLFAATCPWAAAQGAGVQYGAGIVGAVLIVTAAIRFCPLYRLLGVCTA